jgi:hypothetical protein
MAAFKRMGPGGSSACRKLWVLLIALLPAPDGCCLFPYRAGWLNISGSRLVPLT